MKRAKHLWDQVVALDNLLVAAHKAERGKRYRREVAEFNLDLAGQLLRLQTELEDGSYRPGPYRTWTVHERKPRLICAAPYRDRVVHHALCNVIEPVFERGFSHDSYACRAGKGTHASLRRVQQHAGRYPYFLRLDIRRYFPSIDHAILRARLARRIGDRRVLGLIDIILGTFESEEPADLWPEDDLVSAAERRRGLPLGNQTSQFFANVYLDGFDHFVREELGCPGYVRYVDDMVLFGRSKAELWLMLARCEARLAELRLRVHPRKRIVAPVSEGVSWVGYRVLPSLIRLRADNPRHFGRRFRGVVRAVRAGRATKDEARQRWSAWRGHAAQADACRLAAAVWRRTTAA